MLGILAREIAQIFASRRSIWRSSGSQSDDFPAPLGRRIGLGGLPALVPVKLYTFKDLLERTGRDWYVAVSPGGNFRGCSNESVGIPFSGPCLNPRYAYL